MLFTLKDRHSPFTGGVFLFVMTGVFLLEHTGVFLFGLAGGNQFIIYTALAKRLAWPGGTFANLLWHEFKEFKNTF